MPASSLHVQEVQDRRLLNRFIRFPERLYEANYVLEGNYRIRSALEKLELEQCRSYRVYEKALA